MSTNLTSPPTPHAEGEGLLREQAARLIADRGYEPDVVDVPAFEYLRDRALSKADAVLALLAPPAPERDGRVLLHKIVSVIDPAAIVLDNEGYAIEQAGHDEAWENAAAIMRMVSATSLAPPALAEGEKGALLERAAQAITDLLTTRAASKPDAYDIARAGNFGRSVLHDLRKALLAPPAAPEGESAGVCKDCDGTGKITVAVDGEVTCPSCGYAALAPSASSAPSVGEGMEDNEDLRRDINNARSLIEGRDIRVGGSNWSYNRLFGRIIDGCARLIAAAPALLAERDMLQQLVFDYMTDSVSLASWEAKQADYESLNDALNEANSQCNAALTERDALLAEQADWRRTNDEAVRVRTERDGLRRELEKAQAETAYWKEQTQAVRSVEVAGLRAELEEAKRQTADARQDALNTAWRAVDALGGAYSEASGTREQYEARDEAYGAASEAIAKLGGKDPDPVAGTLRTLLSVLHPFAEAARLGQVSGRPPFEFCGADDYAAALSALSSAKEAGR